MEIVFFIIIVVWCIMLALFWEIAERSASRVLKSRVAIVVCRLGVGVVFFVLHLTALALIRYWLDV